MKISKTILLTFLFLKINNCLAQKDSTAAAEYDRFYISLTGGPGTPAGNFTQYDNHPGNYGYGGVKPDNHNLAGEPRPGRIAKLNGSYFFSRYFGCVASVFTGSFKAKDKSIDEVFILNSSMINNSFTYATKSWTASGLMIGITACLPVSKFSFNIKFLGGLQRSVCPLTDVSVTYQYNSSVKSHFIQPSVSSSGFGWDTGIDIRIKTFKKINIILSADYFSGKADYKGNVLYDSEQRGFWGGIDKDSRTIPFESIKQISFFGLTAGIAYVFK